MLILRLPFTLAELARRIAALAPRLAALRRPEDVTIGDVAALARALGLDVAIAVR